MSVVTSLLIISSDSWFNSLNNVAKLNKWLADEEVANPGIKPLDKEQAGGTKYMEVNLFAGGLNGLHQEAFIEFFQSIDWRGTFLILGHDDKEKGYTMVASRGDNTRLDLRIQSLHNIYGWENLLVKEYNQPKPLLPIDEYLEY